MNARRPRKSGNLLNGRKTDLLFLGIIVIGLLAFNLKKNSTQQYMSDKPHQNEENMQPEGDLLMGVSNAICYSGFRSGQHPDRGNGAANPTYEETLEDLKLLSETANFSLIRVYDSGENSEMVLKVIRENDLRIHVMLGIWLHAELSNHLTCAWLKEPIPDATLQQNKQLNLAEIKRGIDLANQYKDIVVAVNVGNEALVDWNDHKVSVDTIISYVRRVKKEIEQEVTVADNYKWWAQSGEALAREVDFISIHVYPVWEEKDIHEGLAYSIENINEVRQALPESRIIISEAGWPTVASEFEHLASEENQKKYYTEMTAWAEENKMTIFFFEAFDEDWKGNPTNMMGAEKHWGLFNIDRTPKSVMQKYYK